MSADDEAAIASSASRFALAVLEHGRRDWRGLLCRALRLRLRRVLAFVLTLGDVCKEVPVADRLYVAACGGGAVDLVEWVLERWPKFNARRQTIVLCAIVACEGGHTRMLQWLTGRHGSMVVRLHAGYLMRVLARGGHMAALRWLCAFMGPHPEPRVIGSVLRDALLAPTIGPFDYISARYPQSGLCLGDHLASAARGPHYALIRGRNKWTAPAVVRALTTATLARNRAVVDAIVAERPTLLAWADDRLICFAVEWGDPAVVEGSLSLCERGCPSCKHLRDAMGLCFQLKHPLPVFQALWAAVGGRVIGAVAWALERAVAAGLWDIVDYLRALPRSQFACVMGRAAIRPSADVTLSEALRRHGRASGVTRAVGKHRGAFTHVLPAAMLRMMWQSDRAVLLNGLPYLMAAWTRAVPDRAAWPGVRFVITKAVAALQHLVAQLRRDPPVDEAAETRGWRRFDEPGRLGLARIAERASPSALMLGFGRRNRCGMVRDLIYALDGAVFNLRTLAPAVKLLLAGGARPPLGILQMLAEPRTAAAPAAMRLFAAHPTVDVHRGHDMALYIVSRGYHQARCPPAALDRVVAKTRALLAGGADPKAAATHCSSLARVRLAQAVLTVRMELPLGQWADITDTEVMDIVGPGKLPNARKWWPGSLMVKVGREVEEVVPRI